jgi:hypothetical protein
MKNMGPASFPFNEEEYRSITPLFLPADQLPQLRKQLRRDAKVKRAPKKIVRPPTPKRPTGPSARALRRSARKPTKRTWASGYANAELPSMGIGRFWEEGDVFATNGHPDQEDLLRGYRPSSSRDLGDDDVQTRITPGVILEIYRDRGEVLAKTLVGNQQKTYVLQTPDVVEMDPVDRIPAAQLHYWLPDKILEDENLIELLDARQPEKSEDELDRLSDGEKARVISGEDPADLKGRSNASILSGGLEIDLENVQLLEDWWAEIRPKADLQDVREI